MGIPALREFICQFCGKKKKKRVPKDQKFCDAKCAQASRKKNKVNLTELPPGDPSFVAHKEMLASERLRKDNEFLRSQNKILRTQMLENEDVISALRESIDALPKVNFIPPPKTKSLVKSTHEEEAVALFSDIHANEVINRLETDGFNEYDFELFCRRMEGWVNGIADITNIHRQAFKLNTLNIFSLGDIISGDIHDELKETNEFPLIQSALQTATVIAQGLIRLSYVYENINFIGVTGNHGRKTKEYRFKQRYDSIESIIYDALENLTANNPRIKYLIPRSPWVLFDIMNHKYLITHGDGKMNSYAGIPYYGLNRKTNAFQAMYRERGGFDLACYGHFHKPVDMGEYMVNGSMVGSNEHAIGAFQSVTKPSQKIFGVSKDYVKTFQYDLYLDNVPEKHEFKYDPDRSTCAVMKDWTQAVINRKYDPR